MKKVMTRKQWRRSQIAKIIVATIVSLIGGIVLSCTFFQPGPTSEYNGPLFLIGLVLLVLGFLSFAVMSDQTYESYRKDALQ